MKTLKQYVAQFVYGAFDGVVTTFAVIAAVAGAGLESGITVVLSLANLIADGFSMGTSAYLSDKSESKENRANKTSHSVGISTFSSFLVVGFIPVLPYLIDIVFNLQTNSGTLFIFSSLLALVAFTLVGIMKAHGSSTSYARSILETLALGAVAAGLAYFLGDFLSSLFGL